MTVLQSTSQVLSKATHAFTFLVPEDTSTGSSWRSTTPSLWHLVQLFNGVIHITSLISGACGGWIIILKALRMRNSEMEPYAYFIVLLPHRLNIWDSEVDSCPPMITILHWGDQPLSQIFQISSLYGWRQYSPNYKHPLYDYTLLVARS